MTLGQNICRLRTERGLSQGDLADALDVSRQSISKWETDASVPELEKLRRSQHVFTPLRPREDCEREYRRWQRAVERARAWEEA